MTWASHLAAAAESVDAESVAKSTKVFIAPRAIPRVLAAESVQPKTMADWGGV